MALKNRQVGKIAAGTCAGVASAAITGWVISPEWQSAAVVAFLFVIALTLIICMQRQARSMKSLIRERANHIVMLNSDMRGSVRRMEDSVRLNEIRLRQIGQFAKSIARDSESSRKHIDGLLKQGADNEARLRQIGQLVKNQDPGPRLEEVMKLSTENEARLRQVGQLVKGQDRKASTYVPLALRNPSGGLNSTGRLAAAVRSDTSRSERVLAAVDASAFSRGRRTVGIVGTTDLQEFLRPNADTCFYLPSMCVAQDAQFRPTTVLIEERAVLSGVWSGALSSTGVALYDEICQLVDAAVARGTSVYFLRNVEIADTNTQDLESKSFVINSQSDFTAEWSNGLGLRFLDELKSYCEKTGEA